MEIEYYIISAIVYAGAFFLLPATIAMQIGIIERRNSSEFSGNYRILSRKRLFTVIFGILATFTLPIIIEEIIPLMIISFLPLVILYTMDFVLIMKIARRA